ncbi:sodium:solute symporter family protein, partial [Cardinium endosymbiont of Culicoides punctatus]|uniref:sodium:solute symporter family protein n=1 Tax=Cardinium endosymbiont of Culicoides punctatus TaxID=2304601 RepID=UPI001058D479
MIHMDLAIIVAFLAITWMLGTYYARGVKTFKDYALGGGMSVFALTCSLIATISDAQTLQQIACIYMGGVIISVMHLILLAMIYFGARVLIVRMAEFRGNFSIADSMGKLYGPIIQRVVAIAVLVTLLSFLVPQLNFVLKVIHFALPNLSSQYAYWITLIVGVIIIIYAALGGARSVVTTDIFQFFCFCCALPVMGYILLRYAKIPLAEGWAQLKLLPKFTDTNYLFSSNALKREALFSARTLLTILTPYVIQRFYMASSVQQGQKTMISSVAARTYICGSLFFLAILLHIGGHTLKPNEEIIHYIINLVQSPIVRGILGVAVLALLMSSVDSALHLMAIVIVNDLLPSSLFQETKSDTIKIQISRGIIVIIGIITLYSALYYKGNIYKLIARGKEIYIPVVSVPFAMAIIGFRPRKFVVLLTMMVSGIFGMYTFFCWSGPNSATYAISIGMAISLCVLVGGHYVFPQLPDTGWVGIKDDSHVILQRQEIKRWWIQQWCNFKSLFTLAYVKGLFPKKESSFILWGIYCIVTGFLALCFMQKAYLFPYIYWHMAVMGIGTIILIYPSFEIYKKETDFIYAVWPMILFGLFFVSSIQFLKLGHYSPMVCALLISHLAASTLFFSIKVSTGLFVGALLLHKFIFSSPILDISCCDILAWQNRLELGGACFLTGLSIAGFSIYKYLYEKFEKKFKIIDLSRIYERRLSLEAIYNQVNWDRLDPTYGSALLKDMSDRLKEPFQYFLDKKEAKLGEVLSLTRSGLYKFSNLLLQRIKEERRFHLHANAIKPVVIDPVIFKVRGDIHGLDEPMQLLLYNQSEKKTLEADPGLFERLLAINLLGISKSEQALDATVTLTIVDTTLKYYYQGVNQEKDSLSEQLGALAFCMSTSAHPEHILSTYQVDDMPTTVFLPKTASKLYQVESRHIVQAHGGYVEITETEEKLVCLYILPINGKRFMRLKTYDPVDLDREVAETPESLAQEKGWWYKYMILLSPSVTFIYTINDYHNC